MYLPTHWKLVNEFRLYRFKKALPWALPVGFFGKSNKNNYYISMY